MLKLGQFLEVTMIFFDLHFTWPAQFPSPSYNTKLYAYGGGLENVYTKWAVFLLQYASSKHTALAVTAKRCLYFSILLNFHFSPANRVAESQDCACILMINLYIDATTAVLGKIAVRNYYGEWVFKKHWTLRLFSFSEALPVRCFNRASDVNSHLTL